MRRPSARPPKPETENEPDPDHTKMQPISIKSLQFPKQNPNSRSKTLKPTSRSKFVPLILFFFSFSIVLYLIVTFSRQKLFANREKYSVIIDGGSTGTRAHVFKYSVDNAGLTRFDFGENGHWSIRVSPGLSGFESDPSKAGESLIEIIEFVKVRVPKEAWGETEVRLMATAGLRLVDEKQRELILEDCRIVLRVSGFKFRNEWASVITGADEGLYAWVVANYAFGTLGGDPKLTTGIIELGGASAQVTFVSSEPVPSEFSHTLEYGNSTYNLYSNSLLHFGQNVAFASMKDLLVSTGSKLSMESPIKELTIDPCTPKGYAQNVNSIGLAPSSLAQKYSSEFHATGNFSECKAAALTLLQRGKEGCVYQHCSLGATFMPKMQGRFLATENFFHTSKFFGLTPKSLLSDLMMAGQQFCEDDWVNIRKKHPSHEEEDLLNYCFSSAYIVALLHDSLGIALDDKRIGCTNQVDNIPLDWALGAFILQTRDATIAENHRWLTLVFDDDSPKLFLLVGAAILLFIVGCYFSRWRKPYFKTIYDLEKGRYIVTRIRN
ncbi:putative apyrase 6 [Silene latifolia]|uniref:putative apyrase 6 n=1 Tax=Silene latifolia TaxID=37657 RepID=UPI003D777935